MKPAIQHYYILTIGNVFFRIAAFVFLLSWIMSYDAVATQKDKTMTNRVDMIVGGDYLVTETDAGLIKNGAVAILGGEIVAVGQASEIHAQFSAPTVLDGTEKILMPGLVNGHTHAAMSLFRGLADDLDLMTWLSKYIFPMEGQFVDAEFIRIGAELACLEMIEGGTTTFSDMYFYPEVTADVVNRCGLRAIISAPMIDFPSPRYQGWDDSFAAGIDFVKEYKNKNSRITPAFAPHAPYTVKPDHLRQVAEAASALDVTVQSHIAEDHTEIKTMQERYNTTSISHYANLGYFKDFHTIGAHVVWPTDQEIQMMSGKPFGAIHNPTSNMKLGAGFSPIDKMIAAGVHVGLGTDGAASNNNLSMWDEIHLAALIHKGNQRNSTVIPAGMAVTMATSGGAHAIGLGDRIGRLEIGKRADMIQISLDKTSLVPIYDAISHLAYAVSADDIVTTIVDGKILMQNSKVLTLDRDQVIMRARTKAAEIKLALEKMDP